MSQLSDYMTNRRSALSMTLEEPGPDAGQIEQMITIASRVPDHGKLAPWRFVLWTPQARTTMHSDLLDVLDAATDLDDKPKKRAGTDKLLHAPCVVAVVSTANDHPKIPRWEQELSAGAVCMNMLIAANGLGFEAQWLTAWYVYYQEARRVLQLSEGEQLAGIIHIGTSTTPKNERPRPQINDIFSIRES